MTEEKLLARIPGQLVNSYKHIQQLHNNLRAKQDREVRDRKGFAPAAQYASDMAVRREMPPSSSTPFSLEKDYAVLLDHHLQALARRSLLQQPLSPPASSHGNRPPITIVSPSAAASPSTSAVATATPTSIAVTPNGRSPRSSGPLTLAPPGQTPNDVYGVAFEETKDKEWNHTNNLTPRTNVIAIANSNGNTANVTTAVRSSTPTRSRAPSDRRSLKTPPRSSRQAPASAPRTPPSPAAIAVELELEAEEKEIDASHGVLARPPPGLDDGEKRTLFPTIETRLVANLFPDVFNKINDGGRGKNGDDDGKGQMPLHLKRQPVLVLQPPPVSCTRSSCWPCACVIISDMYMLVTPCYVDGIVGRCTLEVSWCATLIPRTQT
jgi:hypothetical protein